jgi:hypothetical protein
MSILFSFLGWVLTFVSGFIAIGTPRPGPDYEAAQLSKQHWVQFILLLAFLSIVFGFVRGVRRFHEDKIVHSIAILISSAWFLSLLALVLSV